MAGEHACRVLIFLCFLLSSFIHHLIYKASFFPRLLFMFSCFLSLLILLLPESTLHIILFFLPFFLPFFSLFLSHFFFYFLILPPSFFPSFHFTLFYFFMLFTYSLTRFSFIFAHHALLPILGAFPVSWNSRFYTQNFFETFLSSLCRLLCNYRVFRAHSHL